MEHGLIILFYLGDSSSKQIENQNYLTKKIDQKYWLLEIKSAKNIGL